MQWTTVCVGFLMLLPEYAQALDVKEDWTDRAEQRLIAAENKRLSEEITRIQEGYYKQLCTNALVFNSMHTLAQQLLARQRDPDQVKQLQEFDEQTTSDERKLYDKLYKRFRNDIKLQYELHRRRIEEIKRDRSKHLEG